MRPTASGLTPVEIAILRAIEDLGGVADGRPVRTLEVLERLDAETGVGRRYSERILADLVVDWVRHLPVVDGTGNFGSISGDTGAEARYTEVRLSPVGQLALASERGDVGPLPLDLIEGSLYRGGLVPPLDPATTIRAILIGAGSAGLPRTPTGTITLDPAGLQRQDGRWIQRYQLGATIRTGRDQNEPSSRLRPSWFPSTPWSPTCGIASSRSGSARRTATCRSPTNLRPSLPSSQCPFGRSWT